MQSRNVISIRIRLHTLACIVRSNYVSQNIGMTYISVADTSTLWVNFISTPNERPSVHRFGSGQRVRGGFSSINYRTVHTAQLLLHSFISADVAQQELR